MVRVPRIRTTGRPKKKNNNQYPWSRIGDEQLPSPDTKQDYFDAVVQYSADQVRKAFQNSKLSNMQLLQLDSQYFCLPKDKIDTMVSEITTPHLHYIAERNDCDKFALKFASEVVWTYGSNGVGEVLDNEGQHAYNCLVVAGEDGADPTIEVVEPQNDKVISTADTHHTFKSGIVILY